MLNEMTFFHPEIADLAWVIGSAPLMLPSHDERFPKPDFFDHLLLAYTDRLRYLDAQPLPPAELLNIPPLEPLGKRFERYVKFWLEDSAS